MRTRCSPALPRAWPRARSSSAHLPRPQVLIIDPVAMTTNWDTIVVRPLTMHQGMLRNLGPFHKWSGGVLADDGRVVFLPSFPNQGGPAGGGYDTGCLLMVDHTAHLLFYPRKFIVPPA